ncbi:macrophage mannose receptor 1-like isoform X1 [Salminus brasiliensis]|uniref:macrophage mannose receptor 1-like isoform X1 n=2 Tax=Salminus brasiliensis TaxID=930266 RepID=UPI003B83A0A5
MLMRALTPTALWTLSLCGTRQFHVEKEGKNWTEAQKYCRENFTDLVTIENQEEMDAVQAAVNGTTGNYWIGLRQKPGENNRSWIWSDGSNFSYSDWYTGEPNNGVGDNCVTLKYGYRWNDAACCWSNPFVCYKEIPLILIKQNKTWREALRYCREKHVDLVSVYNKDIQHQVEFVTKGASTANVWMGLHHTCTLSFWFWVSGEFPCYQNWAPGNGTGVEVCRGGERSGAVQSGSKQWVSLLETETLNFICSTKKN